MIRKMNGNTITGNTQLEEHGIPVTENADQANVFAEKLRETVGTPSTPATEEQRLKIEEAKQNLRNQNQTS